MISVSEAASLILRHPFLYRSEEVPLHQAMGRILLHPVLADTDLPPFNRVMMDGIAIRHADWAAGCRRFRVAGVQRAGVSPLRLEEGPACLEVMTGAVMPEGADTVIPYERTRRVEDHFEPDDGEWKAGQHVHSAGRDRKRGDELLPAGTFIGVAETGIAASVGYDFLRVASLPSVTLVSTGDELVDPGTDPAPWQIRKSNVHALRAWFAQFGIACRLAHFADDQAELEHGLSGLLRDSDVLVLTGGVSRGVFDLVPAALERCGVRQVFHRVAQRPGQPMWFGVSGEIRVFAFPGNPVSALACAARYLGPWLRKSYGLHWEAAPVEWTHEVNYRPGLTFFQPVRRQAAGGTGRVSVAPFTSSGDFSSLAGVSGFCELPAEGISAPSGVAYWPLQGGWFN